MSEVSIVNAVIKSARITNEEHGCLTAWIDLDYGGSGQGFGGFVLYSGNSGDSPLNYGGYFIDSVLRIAGVSRWDALVGKTVRAKQTHGSVKAIGHIVKDEWFTPSEMKKDLEK